MDKKICVYAICKNEEKNINQWLNSMQEADYIVVMDTGSTDNSFNMLKKDPRVTTVSKNIIKPWRFDTARNESMKLIPEDADICVCTDIDEIFEEGWATYLREHWEDDTTRCHYLYAWSHNSIGEPQDVLVYDKIHSRNGYHWKFPAHEVVTPDEGFEEVVMDAGENIYEHHLQDTTKNRSSYLDLLILGVKENPTESHCQMMLSREYIIRGDYEKALEEYKKCLEYDDIKTDERIATRIEVFGKLGDICWALQKYDEAIHWFNEFLKICNNHREPYFYLAELYNEIGLFTIAESMVQAGIKYSVRFNDWIEHGENWIAKANDILSVSYYYMRNYDAAIDNANIALEHNPDNIRILKNMNAILMAKVEDSNPISGKVVGG